MKRALEWVGGSVLVYGLVAACVGSGALDGSPSGQGGADDGLNTGGSVSSSGGDGNQSSGAGPSIINPVPDANAAEDGDRIVNVYRTTADGLKTPAGFYDKQLDAHCWFAFAADGKERCLPNRGVASVGTFFRDAQCTQPVASIQKGGCSPTSAGETIGPASCAGDLTWAAQRRYTIGAAVTTTVYSGNSSSCTAATWATNYDFYVLGNEIPPSTYAEGALSHDD